MRFAKIEKIAASVAAGALALVSLVSMTASTQAQEEERPYPKMLPLSQWPQWSGMRQSRWREAPLRRAFQRMRPFWC